MAKSQQTFNKSEKEKKRRKKKKEKAERREQRKLEKAENGKVSFEDLIRYVDENGNLTTEKPDPTKKKKIKLADIQLGAAARDNSFVDPVRNGRVNFFNNEKGFGFISDLETRESVFVHINNVKEPIAEGDRVTYEVEMGPKGPSAINVAIKKAPVKKPTPPKAKESIAEENKAEEGIEEGIEEVSNDNVEETAETKSEDNSSES